MERISRLELSERPFFLPNIWKKIDWKCSEEKQQRKRAWRITKSECTYFVLTRSDNFKIVSSQ